MITRAGSWMGCCSNTFSVYPADVITSNAPHCLWLITALFLHFIWGKLLIIFLCVTPKCAWLIKLNAHLGVWNDRVLCRRRRRLWRNQTPLPYRTTHLEDDSGSTQLLSEGWLRLGFGTDLWRCVSWEWNYCAAVKELSKLPEHCIQGANGVWRLNGAFKCYRSYEVCVHDLKRGNNGDNEKKSGVYYTFCMLTAQRHIDQATD